MELQAHRENLHFSSLNSLVRLEMREPHEASDRHNSEEKIDPSSRGQKGMHGRSPKKPTVGREDDLQWVASATYRRFYFGGIRSLHPKG